MGRGTSGVGADELTLHVARLDDGLDAGKQCRQTVWAVTRPEVVLVVVGRNELAPVTLVNQHNRHLEVAEDLRNELARVSVLLGVDDLVRQLELVQLVVRAVALYAVVLAENRDPQHGNLLV